MRGRHIVLPVLLALAAPFASPAEAAVYCSGEFWSDGDVCTFEAPTRGFLYGGIADEIRDGEQFPWVAVQVTFNGSQIASCYDQGTATEPAVCEGFAQVFAPTLTHVCQVFGSGGPSYHCADPPPLPIPLP